MIWMHLLCWRAVDQDGDHRLEVWIARAGDRNVKEDTEPTDWGNPVFISMQKTEEVVVGNGNQKARREQFPIAPFGTMTIHKALGQTCKKLATRICGGTKGEYDIWYVGLCTMFHFYR